MSTKGTVIVFLNERGFPFHCMGQFDVSSDAVSALGYEGWMEDTTRGDGNVWIHDDLPKYTAIICEMSIFGHQMPSPRLFHR
jgi:hypothetical protein